MAKALELYYAANGAYPAIEHGLGSESTCGSLTENWGHCDRLLTLTTAIAPYISIKPEALSNATQGNYYYSYASQSDDLRQSYGLMVTVETSIGATDGGYYSNAYEVGNNPSYFARAYSGGDADWLNKTGVFQQRCKGGN